MATNRYDLARARGGKDDAAAERGLSSQVETLKGGRSVSFSLGRGSPWEAEDSVDIQGSSIVFLDRNDHTFSPVAIKATVRVMHKCGFRGRFQIGVSGDTITIDPMSRIENRDRTVVEKPQESPVSHSSALQKLDDDELWELALANPVTLFLTSEDDPLLALFDDKGFFFSSVAQSAYKTIKSEPHIYAARFESGDAIYFGISNQQGGRWKRSHAYHLGTLAYQILATTRYDDQNHSHWVEAWFRQDTFTNTPSDLKHRIRMRERIVISFFVPEPKAARNELRGAESRLVSMARRKGLRVLNVIT